MISLESLITCLFIQLSECETRVFISEMNLLSLTEKAIHLLFVTIDYLLFSFFIQLLFEIDKCSCKLI